MATIIDFATGRIRAGATASAGSDTTKKGEYCIKNVIMAYSS